MRVLVGFCLTVALAQAYDIDWSKVTRPQINVPGSEHLIQNDINNPRIVGGQDAELHQFPYQIGLFKRSIFGTSFCGGSLLNEEWVLTAAHCVDSSGEITVVLGAHNISAAEPEQLHIKPNKVIYHENWDSNKILNDVAVIRLSEKVEFNERIQPIRLPTKSQASKSFDDEIGTVSGWGLSSDSASSIAYTLQWVQNFIISNAECRTYFSSYVTAGNICLSGSGGKSTCSGDSGGPLVITDTDGAPTQIGIVSFGSSVGCEKGFPGSFTRITAFHSWISRKTGIPIEP